MFKQATVNAASIPSTQTNFPVYVDLSRVGITTLAEAQSSRWYEDSAKIVEMPREVVSATEGHGKYSSLTSSSQLFIDYDGIRADYGLGDTYGRNTVWSDYQVVHHLNEDPSGTAPQMTDSTGNGISLTSVGSMTSADLVNDGLGKAIDFDGSNDALTNGTQTTLSNHASFTIQCIVRPDSISVNTGIAGVTTLGGPSVSAWYMRQPPGNNSGCQFEVAIGGGFSTVNTAPGFFAVGTLKHVHAVKNVTTGTIYGNGASAASTSFGAGATNAQTGKYGIGRPGSFNGQYFDGYIAEFRYRASALSANWIATEFNNQNDEATFWGTWTEVPSGGTEYTLICEAGTLVLGAAPSALSIGRAITAEAGTLALAAEPATLGVGRTLSLGTGALALTGTSTSLAWSTSLVADSGSLSLNAQNAALRLSYTLDAQTLDLAINSAPAAIYAALTQPLEPGSLLLSGEPVDFVVASIINPFCPMPNPFTNSASPFSRMDNPLTDFPKGEC